MIHFKEQEKVVKIPSIRDFHPSKLFVELININRFYLTNENTSSFKLDFFHFITLLLCTVVPYTLAYSYKERYKQHESFFFDAAVLCLLFPCCCAMSTLSTLLPLVYFSTLLCHTNFFHAAAPCHIFPHSCAMSIFAS